MRKSINNEKIIRNNNSYIHVPGKPGLGTIIDTKTLRKKLFNGCKNDSKW